MGMVSIGQTVEFDYNGKHRLVKVEQVAKSVKTCGADCFIGFDVLADAPIGGYRSFKMGKVEDLVVVG